MKSIGLINAKGGVGKSTSSVNIAAGLAQQGYKTLLIDTDPQASASKHLNIDSPTSLYDLFTGDSTIDQVTCRTHLSSLNIIPASIELVKLGNILSESELTISSVSEILNDTELENYDYVIIDTPPALNITVFSVLNYCDEFIVPVECYRLGIEGLKTLIDAIKELRTQYVIGHMRGILLTRTLRYKVVKEHRQRLEEVFGNMILAPYIPQSVKIAESTEAGVDVLSYAPKSSGAKAYLEIAEEISDRPKTDFYCNS